MTHAIRFIELVILIGTPFVLAAWFIDLLERKGVIRF